ncbi:prolactin receptor b isoform X2 [Antennarius striatus]|uniref:prolactin receptor b isoform X2 n=1 Tax=Antennarius striatus TaxID=241820 RepID=UPI0035AD7F15
MRSDLGLVMLLLLSAVRKSDSTSPPEKPVLLSCRSPEKETFTCWWEPGSDGGLPTTHRLYYERERLEGIHECPDYQSAGKNSCFFEKSYTSIWVDYYLTVVASNALGNATSDPVKIDVMEILKPDVPENVTLLVKEREKSPYLHIQWEHPCNTDTKSGWVTIKYELRVRQDNDKWQEYLSGTQIHFDLYSVIPGVTYMVQVRCMLDHGSWSEWTNTTFVKIPNYPQSEKSLWIMVSTLSLIPLSVTMCILIMKRKDVKQWVLPPVPGPKIRGFDFQLLKNGLSEDALIINPDFHTLARKDQMEEYVTVTENNNGVPRDPSSFHKITKNLVIPPCFQLHLERQCEDSTHIQSECEIATETRHDIDDFVKEPLSGESLSHAQPLHLPQKQQFTCGNCVNTGATEQSESKQQDAVKPFTNGSYVDVWTHAENLQTVKKVDYSRVNNLKGDSVLVQEKNHFTLNSAGYTDVQTQDTKASGDYSRVKEVDSDNKVFLQKHLLGLDPCREKFNHYKDCGLQKPAAGAFKGGMCNEPDSGYVDNTFELR